MSLNAHDLLERLLDPRILVGLTGAVLALVGSRVYRLAVVAPGVAIGGWAGHTLGRGQSDLVELALMVGLAVALALIFHFAERIAIRGTGAAVGGAAARLLAPWFLHSDPDRWWIPALGAAVGVLTFPYLYQSLLPAITSVLGAFCVAWALGREGDLWILGGVTFAGLLVQSIGFGGRSGGGGGGGGGKGSGKGGGAKSKK